MGYEPSNSYFGHSIFAFDGIKWTQSLFDTPDRTSTIPNINELCSSLELITVTTPQKER